MFQICGFHSFIDEQQCKGGVGWGVVISFVPFSFFLKLALYPFLFVCFVDLSFLLGSQCHGPDVLAAAIDYLVMQSTNLLNGCTFAPPPPTLYFIHYLFSRTESPHELN